MPELFTGPSLRLREALAATDEDDLDWLFLGHPENFNQLPGQTPGGDDQPSPVVVPCDTQQEQPAVNGHESFTQLLSDDFVDFAQMFELNQIPSYPQPGTPEAQPLREEPTWSNQIESLPTTPDTHELPTRTNVGEFDWYKWNEMDGSPSKTLEGLLPNDASQTASPPENSAGWNNATNAIGSKSSLSFQTANIDPVLLQADEEYRRSTAPIVRSHGASSAFSDCPRRQDTATVDQNRRITRSQARKLQLNIPQPPISERTTFQPSASGPPLPLQNFSMYGQQNFAQISSQQPLKSRLNSIPSSRHQQWQHWPSSSPLTSERLPLATSSISIAGHLPSPQYQVTNPIRFAAAPARYPLPSTAAQAIPCYPSGVTGALNRGNAGYLNPTSFSMRAEMPGFTGTTSELPLPALLSRPAIQPDLTPMEPIRTQENGQVDIYDDYSEDYYSDESELDQGKSGTRKAYRPQRHDGKAWVRHNHCTEGKYDRSKAALFEPARHYRSLRRAPRPWGPFHYTADGELRPGKTYSAEQLHQFLSDHPLHNGVANKKQSGLRLYIQRVPADSVRRKATRHSDECRFDKCEYKGKPMAIGHFRVAFDERSHYESSGSVRYAFDPYISAGYVHLYCLERFLNFPDICRHLDVRPDLRDLGEQQADPKYGRPNRMGLVGKTVIETVENFLNAINRGQIPEGYPQVPEPGHGFPFEGSLCKRMHLAKLRDEPPSKSRKRKELGNKDTMIHKHAGDLKLLRGKQERAKKTKRAWMDSNEDEAEEADDEGSEISPVNQAATRQQPDRSGKRQRLS